MHQSEETIRQVSPYGDISTIREEKERRDREARKNFVIEKEVELGAIFAPEHLPHAWWEYWNERVAMRELNSNQDRGVAETCALVDAIQVWRRLEKSADGLCI